MITFIRWIIGALMLTIGLFIVFYTSNILISINSNIETYLKFLIFALVVTGMYILYNGLTTKEEIEQ